MKTRCLSHVAAATLLCAMLTPQLDAQTYDWTGNQNNNWDNGANWTGASGWPDSSAHTARFDSSNYGSGDTDVDLRSGTFDVGTLNLSSSGFAMQFFAGTIRLNGGMSFAHPAAGGSGSVHDFDVNLVQVSDGTWQGGARHHVGIDGVLSGSGTITTRIIQTGSIGNQIARLNNANTYNGNMIIRNGYVTLGHDQALENSRVTLRYDNGLRPASGINPTIAALDGNNTLNVQSSIFKVNGSANTTFSGDITGSATGRFVKSGSSTLTLLGDVSGIGRLQLSDGEMHIKSNSVTVMELVAGLDEMRIEDGADVSLGNTGTAWSGSTGTLLISGGGSQLRNGAELAAATGTGEGTINILDSGSVSDFDIVTAGRLGTGDIIVQGNGTLTAAALGLGGKNDGTNGGTGELSVLTGGDVTIQGETRLWTDTSQIFVFADGSMSTWTLTNPDGTSPTIQIQNPSGGEPALTIGTDSPVPSTTFSGIIQDISTAGTLMKVGSNHVVLSGNNTYSGGTVIDGGTLGLGHDSALGTGPITVLGSTLDYADTIVITNAIVLGTNVTLHVATGSATQAGIISDTNGGFGISKTGAGDLTLSAANTFSGVADIDAGRILIADTNALAHSTVSINVDGGLDVTNHNLSATLGAITGTGDLELGANDLAVGGNDDSTTYSGVMGGSGSLTKDGAGTLTLNSAKTYTGGTFINAGRVKVNFASTLPSGGSVVNNSELEFEMANSGTFAGLISGTGDLIKSGTHQLGLSASNTFSGMTVIDTFALNMHHSLALQNSTVQLNVDDGLGLSETSHTIGGLSGTGNLTLGTKTLAVGNNDESTAYSGVLSGSGTFNKIGSGTLTVSGANPFSGLLDILDGDVKLGTATTLQNASVRINSALGLDLNGFDATLGALAGGSAFNLGSQSITIGSNNSSRFYGGVISGNGGITKVGNGTWNLGNANTFTGSTIISGGSLLGNGSVAGPLTIQGSGTVSPGPSASTGTFTAGGDITLAGTYTCEIDGAAADQLVTTANINLNGSTLDFDTLGGGVTGDAYIIARYGTLTGTFNSVMDLPADYTLDYTYDDGSSTNNIALIEASLSYDTWVASFGLTGTNAAFDVDADGDGGKNGYEWATGTVPTNAASITPLSISDAGDDAVIHFTRNTNATDVTLRVERSADLTDTNTWTGVTTNTLGVWNPSSIVTETGTNNPVDVDVTDSLTNNPAANYRLQVTKP